MRRLAATIEHLSRRQIVTRVKVLALRRWWRATGATLSPLEGSTLRPEAAGAWPADIGAASLSTGAVTHADAVAEREAMQAGQYTFLGRTVSFSGEIDWHAPSESQLWRYHLQYFGWVPTLIIADVDGSRRGADLFRSQLASWLRGNQTLRGDGWHPYTLSLRIVNWLKAWAAWRDTWADDPVFCRQFAEVLAAQVVRLDQQLEFDVRGNHLMENARALYWAGTFFADDLGERWRLRSEQIFTHEIPEQVLSDGAHFERTPGYHTTMLALLSEVAVLATRNGTAAPAGCVDAIRRMARFLTAMLGPDGRIPLLKDTAYDAAAAPEDVLFVARAMTGDRELTSRGEPSLSARLSAADLASRIAPPEFPATPDPHVSGFFVVQGRGDFLVVDCGRPCPDYLPAHAHADALSYELHVGGLPTVVDSGVFQYAAGTWRDYFRSTAAHNTVEVAGLNSSDVWASFRVGQRARVICPGRGEWGKGYYLVAEHDGYRRLPQRILHRRCFIHLPGEFLAVLDLIEGAGRVEMVSHVHLHPEIASESGESHRLSRDGSTIAFVRPLNVAAVTIQRGEIEPRRQGWYSERFGEKTPNTVLAFSAAPQVPQAFGYIIAPQPVTFATLALRRDAVELRADIGDRHVAARWVLDTNQVK